MRNKRRCSLHTPVDGMRWAQIPTMGRERVEGLAHRHIHYIGIYTVYKRGIRNASVVLTQDRNSKKLSCLTSPVYVGHGVPGGTFQITTT